jgi:hypothetical protein
MARFINRPLNKVACNQDLASQVEQVTKQGHIQKYFKIKKRVQEKKVYFKFNIVALKKAGGLILLVLV